MYTATVAGISAKPNLKIIRSTNTRRLQVFLMLQVIAQIKNAPYIESKLDVVRASLPVLAGPTAVAAATRV